MALMVGSLLLVSHGAAYACSCRQDRSDVMTQLRSALEGADAVFLGRVVAQRERQPAVDSGNVYTTTLQVLEQYKGKVQEKLEMPSGNNDGDCTFRFVEGKTYLVYAYRNGETLKTAHCTRSRKIGRFDDSELVWLRTRVPLPVPVALQRKVVTCNRCDLDVVTRELLGPKNPRGCGNIWLDDKKALAAFKAGQPFWSKSTYDEEMDPKRDEAMGLSKDGRAFELVQTPFYAADETCRQEVRLRWCKRLEPTERESWLPAFACIEPSSEIEMCNETKTRAAADGPRESLSAIKECDLWEPDNPQCTLAAAAEPAKEGSPASPLLYCIPKFDYPESRDYSCHVIDSSAPAPVSK
jgi:hypothetical protein